MRHQQRKLKRQHLVSGLGFLVAVLVLLNAAQAYRLYTGYHLGVLHEPAIAHVMPEPVPDMVFGCRTGMSSPEDFAVPLEELELSIAPLLCYEGENCLSPEPVSLMLLIEPPIVTQIQ